MAAVWWSQYVCC